MLHVFLKNGISLGINIIKILGFYLNYFILLIFFTQKRFLYICIHYEFINTILYLKWGQIQKFSENTPHFKNF